MGGSRHSAPQMLIGVQAEPTPLPNPPPQGGRETRVLMVRGLFTRLPWPISGALLTFRIARAYKPRNTRRGFSAAIFFGIPAGSRVNDREAHLSAEQPRAQAPSWISRPHGNRRRMQGAQCAPRPRLLEALRLTQSAPGNRFAGLCFAAVPHAPGTR